MATALRQSAAEVDELEAALARLEAGEGADNPSARHALAAPLHAALSEASPLRATVDKMNARASEPDPDKRMYGPKTCAKVRSAPFALLGPATCACVVWRSHLLHASSQLHSARSTSLPFYRSSVVGFSDSYV